MYVKFVTWRREGPFFFFVFFFFPFLCLRGLSGHADWDLGGV